jgi:hypothetical protein
MSGVELPFQESERVTAAQKGMSVMFPAFAQSAK